MGIRRRRGSRSRLAWTRTLGLAALTWVCFVQGVRAQPSGGDSAPGAEDIEAEFEDPGKAHEVFDPLRGYNRFMFRFNDKFYFWFAKPAAKGYSKVVPEPARTAFGRAFQNVRFPARFLSCLLQLELKKAGTEMGRFLVNTTFGFYGFFDPAGQALGWHSSQEDFGQALGRYGVGEGFPLVLPFLGPSNLRDGIALIPYYAIHPVGYFTYVDPELSWQAAWGITGGEYLNHASLHLGEYESLKKDALDPYTFMRDAYKQNRDEKIRE